MEECKHWLTVDVEALSACLRRMVAVSGDKNRTVLLSMSKTGLHVRANSPEMEVAEEEVDAEYFGEPIEVGFNAGYLIEALATLPTDTAQFGLTGAANGCLLQPWGQPNCQFVLMPMKI